MPFIIPNANFLSPDSEFNIHVENDFINQKKSNQKVFEKLRGYIDIIKDEFYNSEESFAWNFGENDHF